VILPAALARRAVTVRVVLAACVVALVALMGARVSAWHDAYGRLQATEKALARTATELRACTAEAAVVQQAAAQAATLAERQAAADRAAAERVSHALQTRLADADRAGRELARRLHDYQNGRCADAVPAAAGAAAEPAGASGEPADDAQTGGGAVDVVHAEVLAACGRDALRLEGWITWWGEVSAGRP